MRAAVIYFSLTGNTQKIAANISEFLSERNVETTEVRLQGGEGSFMGNSLRALLRSRSKTEEKLWDLSEFDFIFLGTPVWAFSPVPAINTFLDRCKGLDGKKGNVFVTYGSGTGKERALKIMKKQLLEKGMKDVFSFSISDKVIKQGSSLDKKVSFFLNSSPCLL